MIKNLAFKNQMILMLNRTLCYQKHPIYNGYCNKICSYQSKGRLIRMFENIGRNTAFNNNIIHKVINKSTQHNKL